MQLCPASRPERPEPIDLTVDDDEELQKAMAASLQDVDMNFQPTTAPDPNWAVVPANVLYSLCRSTTQSNICTLRKQLGPSMEYHKTTKL